MYKMSLLQEINLDVKCDIEFDVVNDFDVESMMRFAAELDEHRRFDTYRRIADVCLFVVGFLSPTGWSRFRMKPGEYREWGQRFYRMAADHESARVRELTTTLSDLSAHFNLAAKPLIAVSRRYVRLLTEQRRPAP